MNAIQMIAMIGLFGNGIALLFLLLLVAVFVLIWIASWIRRGFRSRGWNNPQLTRRIALITFTGSLIVMALFPPLRRIGNWTILGNGDITATHHPAGYDRGFFGFIPRYASLGHIGIREVPEWKTGYGLRQGEMYFLESFTWQIDWVILFGQFVLAMLIAYPYLLAENRVLHVSDSRKSFR